MEEGTLEEWTQWFAKERSEEYSVVHSFAQFPSEEQKFVRLWTVSDGKHPDGALFYQGKIWENKRRTIPRRNNTCVIKGPCPPLLLSPTESASTGLSGIRFPDRLPGQAKSIKLEKPYRWRCRRCGEEGQMDAPTTHCGVRTRQLAQITEQTHQWFSDFIQDTTWRFVDPTTMRIPEYGFYDDEEALALAREAGKEFEMHINSLQSPLPEVYELFDRRTPHLRVSDLKKKEKIKESLRSAIDMEKRKQKLLLRKPSSSTIELGSVFDEYLDHAIGSLSSDIWSGKRSVEFFIPPFGVVVRGTPDNFLNHIPIETKTVNMLPVQGRTSKVPNWKNYLTQLAIYSRACGLDWMFLLMISRANGEFSIIPFNATKRMDAMEKEWEQLTKQKKFTKLLNQYKAIHGIADASESE